MLVVPVLPTGGTGSLDLLRTPLPPPLQRERPPFFTVGTTGLHFGRPSTTVEGLLGSPGPCHPPPTDPTDTLPSEWEPTHVSRVRHLSLL